MFPLVYSLHQAAQHKYGLYLDFNFIVPFIRILYFSCCWLLVLSYGFP